jgi:hypothetical protein
MYLITIQEFVFGIEFGDNIVADTTTGLRFYSRRIVGFVAQDLKVRA